MEIQMTSKLTMHQLNAAKPKQRTDLPFRRGGKDRRIAVEPDGVTAPKVGTEIDIDMDLVVFENESGTSKTPMLKLRYSAADKRWVQVSVNLAGMLAFFDTEPADDCKRVRVVRLIPNGRACYVVPV